MYAPHPGRRNSTHAASSLRAFLAVASALFLVAWLMFTSGPATVRATSDTIEIAVTLAAKDGWYLGGGPVTMAASVDLLAGTISGTGTTETSDGIGKAKETLVLTGSLDPSTGAITASVKGDYSYVIDADNTWIKAYAGTFTATMTSFDMWVGEGSFAFGTVKRVGAVGNRAPAAGQTYAGTVQILVKSGSLTIKPPSTIQALVTNVSGDVQYSRDGGKTFQPLTTGTILPAGAVVQTGFESSANLDFGYGSLSVPQTVGLTLDELTSSANLRRTQLHLNIGAVAARIRHTDGIRSDFSVTTPTANASIRGSAMIVSIDATTGVTTVWVTEDAAFVQGSADATEVEVPAGQRVDIGKDGRAGALAPFKAGDLPTVPETAASAPPAATSSPAAASGGPSERTDGSMPLGVIAGAIVAVVVVAVVAIGVARRRGGVARTQ